LDAVWRVLALAGDAAYPRSSPCTRLGDDRFGRLSRPQAQVVEPMIATILGLLLAVAAFSGLTVWLIRQA